MRGAPAPAAQGVRFASAVLGALILIGCTTNRCTDSICGDGNDHGRVAPETRTPVVRVNTAYLADLVRKGPFSEPLPGPLQAQGIKDVTIADSSPRLDAVAIELDWPPTNDPFEGFDGPRAHIETYGQKADATRHAEGRFTSLRDQYKDFGKIQGSPAGFFLFANGEIIAGGSRGFVYVEAYSFPDSNADVALATGTVNAMLRYADRMTAIASSSP